MPPDLKPTTKGAVRGDIMLGINRIGLATKLPAPSSVNEPLNKGVYISNCLQNDVKIGSWTVKAVMPIIHLSREGWGTSLRTWLDQNIDKVRDRIKEKDRLLEEDM